MSYPAAIVVSALITTIGTNIGIYLNFRFSRIHRDRIEALIQARSECRCRT